MDFAYDDHTRELAERLQAFLVEHVYPAEAVLHEQVRQARGTDREWSRPAVVGELKAAARAQGLWNLFIPGAHGAGLTNAQYAPLAELTGRSPWLAPEALNCAAPDTGNMEVLAEFGTAGAAGAVARTVAGRADPVRLLHDRARGRLVRRDEHRDQHPARR